LNKKKPVLKKSAVYKALREAVVIENVDIHDLIDLEKVTWKDFNPKDCRVNFPVTFRNCNINSLWVANLTFTERFTLENCIIENCNFLACYLLSGITIDNCTFKEDMFLFAAGGHNSLLAPIIIINSVFYGLVDFGDAWFKGPVKITGCDFIAGTNLLGNIGKVISVNSELTPEIFNNNGNLALNGDLMDWKGVPIEVDDNTTQVRCYTVNQRNKKCKKFLFF
jgi:hypothetical protein